MPNFISLSYGMSAAYDKLARSPFLKRFEQAMEWLCLILLAAGPFVLLLGNTMSDVWLGLMIGFWVDQLNRTRFWPRFFNLWFCVALACWLWFIIAGYFSINPGASMLAAFNWIRFPLFGLAFACILIADVRRQRVFFWACAVSLLILATIYFQQRLSTPWHIRLPGPWSQGATAGVMVAAMGMVCAMILFDRMKGWRDGVIAFVFSLLVVLTIVNTGETYTTLSILFGFGLYGASRITNLRNLGLVMVGCGLSLAAAGAFLLATPAVFARMVGRFGERLPWRETSDYYSSWILAIEYGQTNLLNGIGPSLSFAVCESDVARLGAASGFTECPWHPHQLYLQMFAEAGVIGVLLFVTLVAALLLTTWRLAKKATQEHLHKRTAHIVLIVAFWPISTYPDAFGQHRNFFLWMTIALTLTLAAQGRAKPLVPSRAYKGD